MELVFAAVSVFIYLVLSDIKNELKKSNLIQEKRNEILKNEL